MFKIKFIFTNQDWYLMYWQIKFLWQSLDFYVWFIYKYCIIKTQMNMSTIGNKIRSFGQKIEDFLIEYREEYIPSIKSPILAIPMVIIYYLIEIIIVGTIPVAIIMFACLLEEMSSSPVLINIARPILILLALYVFCLIGTNCIPLPHKFVKGKKTNQD